MVNFNSHKLYRHQICESVPDLIRVVTSSLSFDPDDILAQLSPNPARFRRRIGKRCPCKTGYYLPSRNSDTKKRKWFNWRAKCKKRGPNEFATFLNEITDKIRSLTLGAGWKKGKTDLVFMEKPKLNGPSTDMDDTPDFVLVEREKAKSQDPTWNDVHCVGALRSDSKFEIFEIVAELGEYARRCISRRLELRFVLGLAFLVHETTMEFCLIVFDRTGTLCSHIFDIDEEPIDFLRGAIGLPLMSLTNLGGDPTFFTKDDGKYIRVADMDYKILRNIFRSKSMNGNGTRCYEVEGPDGKRYAARDSWTLSSDTLRESEFLDLIKDIENVPRIQRQEIVKITPKSGESFLDSTKHLRASLLESMAEASGHDEGPDWMNNSRWSPEIRDHQRTIISPCGEPLTDFASLPELVSATLDIFETVDTLNDRGMLHSDISSGNIILVPVEGSPWRKGFLIDFETAVKYESERFVVKDYCTTIMTSPDILLRRSHRTALHEAESILYVLLFIALVLDGPGGKERQNFDFDASMFEVALSTNPYYYYALEDRKAMAKKKIMDNAESFESGALKDISPYFNPIKNCLALLRDAILSPEGVHRSDLWEMSYSERRRITEERTAQRIKSILAKCKGILRDTLAELTDPKAEDQPIAPSSPENHARENEHADLKDSALSKALIDNQTIEIAAAETNLNVATVGERTPSDAPQQNLNPEKSTTPHECNLQHTSPEARKPKRLLMEKDLNIEGDCPEPEIRAKRLKSAT